MLPILLCIHLSIYGFQVSSIAHYLENTHSFLNPQRLFQTLLRFLHSNTPNPISFAYPSNLPFTHHLSLSTSNTPSIIPTKCITRSVVNDAFQAIKIATPYKGVALISYII